MGRSSGVVTSWGTFGISCVTFWDKLRHILGQVTFLPQHLGEYIYMSKRGGNYSVGDNVPFIFTEYRPSVFSLVREKSIFEGRGMGKGLYILGTVVVTQAESILGSRFNTTGSLAISCVDLNCSGLLVYSKWFIHGDRRGVYMVRIHLSVRVRWWFA